MKELEDIVYEVEGKFIIEKEGDYGISANADEDAGEGAAGEGTNPGEKRVINIVSAHRLQETGFDKVRSESHFLLSCLFAEELHGLHQGLHGSR